MVHSCFVPDCDHNSKKNSCKFKSIPKSPERRLRWLKSIGRVDKEPSKYSFICSCHFSGGGTERRKRTPTIFKRHLSGPSRNIIFPSPEYLKGKRKILTSESGDSTFNESVSSVQSSDKEATTLNSSHSVIDLHHVGSDCALQRPPKKRKKLSSSNQDIDWKPEFVPFETEADDPVPLPDSDENSESSTSCINLDKTIPTHSVPQHASTPAPARTQSPVCMTWAFNSRRKPKSPVQKPKWNIVSMNPSCLSSSAFNPPGEIGLSSDLDAPLSFSSDEGKDCVAETCKQKKEILKSRVSSLKEGLKKAQEALKRSQEAHRSSLDHVCKLEEEKGNLQKEIIEMKQRAMDLEDKFVDEKKMIHNQYKSESEAIQKKWATQSREILRLTLELEAERDRLTFSHISVVDAHVAHYTGLPNAKTFRILLNMFPQPLNYYYGWNVKSMSPENQLFLSLMKLKLNFDYMDLAHWFNVSKQTVGNIFLTWLDALHTVIFKKPFSNVPSREKNKKSLPECFKGFENCRMIIDCTEVYTSVPQSMNMHNLVYSQYKHRTTYKGLIGIAPNGTVTYLSDLYPGSTSDKCIVQNCGILSVFKPGDLILADKGFLIRDVMPKGVTVNIPPFADRPQFTPEQVQRTLKIARARIHVERAIARVKEYRILDYIPSYMKSYATTVWQVCGALTNWKRPLIKEVEDMIMSSKYEIDDDEGDNIDEILWE